jgi:uncharacterized protein (DUF1697 family)
MIVYVALLRGINVGGNNMISMKALKGSFERLGFTDVSTYINSGNILFKSKSADARKLEATIEKMLVAEYKLGCKVVVRSAEEMARLIEKLPKSWADDKEWRYNVIFLRHAVDSKDVIKSFNPTPDIEYVLYVPGTLLWSARAADWLRTSMQKLPRQKIFQEITVRNLNTTRKLHALLQAMSNRESAIGNQQSAIRKKQSEGPQGPRPARARRS